MFTFDYFGHERMARLHTLSESNSTSVCRRIGTQPAIAVVRDFFYFYDRKKPRVSVKEVNLCSGKI